MKNKYTQVIIMIVAFLVLGITTIASYAYFTATLQGNDRAYDTVITSGDMALMLNDGAQVSLANAIPGDSITKEFSVKNTGTVETTYDVYLSEIINLFEDKNDLVFRISSTNGCSNNDENIFPSAVGDQSKIVSACSINPNQTHDYQLIITFKNDGTNQDDNQSKSVISKISVNEYDSVAYLIDGWNFQNALKGITGSTFQNEKTNLIKHINVVDSDPDSSVETINIADESSNTDVLMWLDDDTAKIYTTAKDIYLNDNSEYMFYYLELNELDLSNFNTSLVTNMSAFFDTMTAEEITLGEHFDTSNVKNMNYMFNATSLNSYDLINDLDFSNVETLYKFLGNTTKEIDIELKNIYLPKARDFRYMFNSSKFRNIKFTNVEAPKINDVTMFFKYIEAETITFENSFNSTSMKVMREFVYGANNLVSFDFGSFNIKGTEELTHVFSSCPKLANLNLGSNFDTSQTKKIDNFISDGMLEEFDLGEKFDTSNMQEIRYIVSGNENLKVIHLGNKFDITPTIDIYGLIISPAITTIYIGPDAKVYPNTSKNVINGYDGVAPYLVGGAGTTFDPENNTAEYLRIDDPANGKPGYFTLDPRYQ